MNPAENPLASRGPSNIERDGRESFHEQQRRALGIPASLRERPVLYMSAHRGAFSAEHEGHVAEFVRVLQGGETDVADNESAYIDLSEGNPEQVVELLRLTVLKADPSTEQKTLPSQSGKSEPLPGYLANVIFLPALDAKGNCVGSESSKVFAIDGFNHKTLLPDLANFLKEKGIMNHPTDQMEGETIESPRKMIE